MSDTKKTTKILGMSTFRDMPNTVKPELVIECSHHYFKYDFNGAKTWAYFKS